MSSTEAEMKGYSYCAMHISWIRNILKYVYRVETGVSIMEVDNQPAIQASINAHVTKNLLHMDSKHWYIRQAYQNREIILAKCHTTLLLADALTKHVSRETMCMHLKQTCQGALLGQHNLAPATEYQ